MWTHKKVVYLQFEKFSKLASDLRQKPSWLPNLFSLVITYFPSKNFGLTRKITNDISDNSRTNIRQYIKTVIHVFLYAYILYLGVCCVIVKEFTVKIDYKHTDTHLYFGVFVWLNWIKVFKNKAFFVCGVFRRRDHRLDIFIAFSFV